jgi:hypothetical protein
VELSNLFFLFQKVVFEKLKKENKKTFCPRKIRASLLLSDHLEMRFLADASGWLAFRSQTTTKLHFNSYQGCHAQK